MALAVQLGAHRAIKDEGTGREPRPKGLFRHNAPNTFQNFESCPQRSAPTRCARGSKAPHLYTPLLTKSVNNIIRCDLNIVSRGAREGVSPNAAFAESLAKVVAHLRYF